MTGCYAWKVGQQPGANIFANLTGNCATVMELLKENGYQTCMVGRMDMVTVAWNDPAQIPGAANRYLGAISGGPGNYYREASGTPWYKDGARYVREEGDYSTDLTTAFVSDFIEGTAGSFSIRTRGTYPFPGLRWMLTFGQRISHSPTTNPTTVAMTSFPASRVSIRHRRISP